MFCSFLGVDKLKDSKYGKPDTLDHITQRFDETTKRLFRDKKELAYIQFGSPLDKDLSVGIRHGQLKLTGYVWPMVEILLCEASTSSHTTPKERGGGVFRALNRSCRGIHKGTDREHKRRGKGVFAGCSDVRASLETDTCVCSPCGS